MASFNNIRSESVETSELRRSCKRTGSMEESLFALCLCIFGGKTMSDDSGFNLVLLKFFQFFATSFRKVLFLASRSDILFEFRVICSSPCCWDSV